MKGDFSRDSFRPAAGFTRVLSQQGRIALDADANESQAIQLYFLRTLAADLMGPHIAAGDGFLISVENAFHWDFLITPGRCYVDGWLCENRAQVAWRGDDDHPGQPFLAEPPQPQAGTYLAYLEVWERSVSAAEHDGLLARAVPGALREVALGGVDTAGRAQLTWRVGLAPIGKDETAPAGPMTDADWTPWQNRLSGAGPGRGKGTLKARAAESAVAEPDPCLVSPRAAYRGHENHLYRVEICRGGAAGTTAQSATFVWSRDNGSTLLAVEAVDGPFVRLAQGWRDAASAIGPGDHVEISSPQVRLDPGPGPIRRVTGYDPDTLTLTLDEPAGIDAGRVADGVVVRRWDHVAARAETGVPPIADDHALTLVEGRWLTLEDGISIMFGDEPRLQPAPHERQVLHFAADEPPVFKTESAAFESKALGRAPVETAIAGRRAARAPGVYRSGDYWLFEARVDIGDVVWPRSASDPPQPLPVPPHGVERHYAPLATVTFAGDGAATAVDLRRTINPVYED